MTLLQLAWILLRSALHLASTVVGATVGAVSGCIGVHRGSPGVSVSSRNTCPALQAILSGLTLYGAPCSKKLVGLSRPRSRTAILPRILPAMP